MEAEIERNMGRILFGDRGTEGLEHYILARQQQISSAHPVAHRGLYYSPGTPSIVLELGEYELQGERPEIVRQLMGEGGVIERLELSPHPYSYFIVEAPYEEARRFVRQVARVLVERTHLYQGKCPGVSVVALNQPKAAEWFSDAFSEFPLYFVQGEKHGETIDARLR